jgi:hypothetical protein
MLPQQNQREIVARGKREILRAAQEIRARKAEMRRADRIERLAAACNQPFPSDRRYAVIYADPPWHFKVYNEECGIERAAANHYSTMSLDEICALPIPSLARPDAALFMWTTVPHLRESFQVLDAWGFEYKTNIVLGERQDWSRLFCPKSTRIAACGDPWRHAVSAGS